MDSSGWDERYKSVERLWSAGPNLFVEDRLGPVEPGVGLDLAAGEGRNAVWLSNRGWSMTAVDFSAAAIEKGRGISDDIRFEVGDVFTWDPDRSFDLVLIAYLHLLPEQLSAVVARASGWLEPEGELFLIGHDRSNLDDGYGGPQVPEILWDVDVIRGWLDGLTVIEAEVVRRPVQTDDGTVFARDTLVRARVSPRTEPV